MTTRKIGPIGPPVSVQAYCPLGHDWHAMAQEFYRGRVQAEGKVNRHKFETVVTHGYCPICGHRWCRLLPVS